MKLDHQKFMVKLSLLPIETKSTRARLFCFLRQYCTGMYSRVFLEFGWNFSSSAASHHRLRRASYSRSNQKLGHPIAKVRLIEEVLDEPADPVARSVHALSNQEAR